MAFIIIENCYVCDEQHQNKYVDSTRFCGKLNKLHLKHVPNVTLFENLSG